MVIKYLLFEETCAGRPESYSVYNQKISPIYKCVAFINLIDGKLTCDYVTGETESGELKIETIYTEIFEYKYQGEFENEEQRLHYLNIIADRICEKIETDDTVK